MPEPRLREQIRPPLTGTVSDSKKIPISETVEFLYHLFQFHSSTSSAKSNMNADSTGLYRVVKLFLAAEEIQDGIAFEDKVLIDEKYVPIWKSNRAKKASGGETKGLPDKRNPIESVNRVHRFLEFFLKRHSGYKREDLLGCLNHFANWYNTPGTAMEKAIKFIEMTVKKRKMLRYRAWGSKKKHDED